VPTSEKLPEFWDKRLKKLSLTDAQTMTFLADYKLGRIYSRTQKLTFKTIQPHKEAEFTYDDFVTPFKWSCSGRWHIMIEEFPDGRTHLKISHEERKLGPLRLFYFWLDSRDLDLKSHLIAVLNGTRDWSNTGRKMRSISKLSH
jgi:hypothetical protein